MDAHEDQETNRGDGEDHWVEPTRSVTQRLNELDIVRDVSRRLEQGGFSYMLTGSMALNYCAQPRMRDVKNLVGTGCDAEYIGRWTSELGLNSLWQECKS